MQLAFTHAEPTQALFKTVAVDARAWGLILSLAAAKFLLVELEKLLLRQLGIVRL